MAETILQKLLELEQLENIKILYAYESGSRVWGFASYQWLQSPIIYRGDAAFDDDLRKLMSECFLLRSGANHYKTIR